MLLLLTIVSAWFQTTVPPEEDALGLLLRARYAMVTGDFQQALAWTERVIERHPNLAEAVYLRIETLLELQNGQIVPAPEDQVQLIKSMIDATAQFPDDYRFPKLVGVLLVSNPRWRQLTNVDSPDVYLQRAKRLLAKDLPQSTEELADTHYYLGRWHRTNEDFFAAAEAFRRVCDLTPDNTWAWYYAGQAFEYSHQLRTAKRYYQQFVDLGDQSLWQGRPLVEVNLATIDAVIDPSPAHLAKLNRVFQLREPDSVTLKSVAQRFLLAGHYYQARELLQRLPQDARGPRFRALWLEALMSTRQYSQALAFSQRALFKRLESADRTLVVDYALEAAVLSGQHDAARRLIEQYRDVPGLALRLDLMNAILDALDGANFRSWQQLVERHGEREFIRLLAEEARRNGLGVVVGKYVSQLFIGREDYLGARQFLFQLWPADQLPSGLQEELAITYAMMGQTKHAFAIYDQLVEEQPERADLLNNYGFFLADQALQLERAAGLIQQALKQDEANPAFLDSMGWVQFRLGNLVEARRYLQQALRSDPDDPEKLEHLGDVVAALGEAALAKQYWSRAMEHTDQRYLQLLDKLDPNP